MITAFQPTAFQNDAFQIDGTGISSSRRISPYGSGGRRRRSMYLPKKAQTKRARPAEAEPEPADNREFLFDKYYAKLRR